MVRRRRDKRIWYVVGGVFIAVFLFTFLSQNFRKTENSADAASLANFDPGYIISDYTMGNYNSMSEADIQTFLNSKGNCRDTRTYLAQQYSGYSYHIRDGHFVCLAEEKFGDGAAYGDDVSNGQTAAHIIWQAAQDYKINPQVLIVLLQKEQSLITDSWPNSVQYRSATGYGCPDTAPCSSEYYGFKNQVRKAAAMFRDVLDGGWTNYPLGNNYIQYNPNVACGGSVVNVRSLATSALYRYTPYQPNAGALAAGYGTAACGAYGNRNFYLYFEDWFSGIGDEGEISEYYHSIGGENSILGPATSEEKCGLVKNGCFRSFLVGRIYWTKNTGAWDVSGRIYDRWYKLGTEWSALGYPISSERRNLINNGAFQKFENGRIYYSPKTGAWEIGGDIYSKWYELGTEWSSLGYPTSGEQKDKNGIVYQQFEHGRIYYANGETWVIPEWSQERYEKIGSINSVLKTPVSDAKCGLVQNGCYQNFIVGRMYYTDKTGAWDISGKIYSKWYELGTEWSSLGYPTSGEQKDENGIVYQQFEHGRIYYANGETWVIPEWSQERYEKIGSINSVLKTPVSDAKCGLVQNGCYQNFIVGRMYYTDKTGAWDISGKIYSKWYELGTEWSSLGYPTSGEQKDENGIVYQQFEHGRIYYANGETWVK